MKTFFRKAVDKAEKTCIQFAYLFGHKQMRPKSKDIIAPRTYELKGIPAEVSVSPVYKNRKGIVTIVSDDGDFSTGKIVDELSRKYQVPFSIGGTVQNIARHEAWWKQVIENNLLMELVNHSYNHISMGSASDISSSKVKLTHELIHSKRYFEGHFGKKQICFICPENQMCPMGYDLLRKNGIIAVRRGARGYNDLRLYPGEEPGELYNLRIRGIMDEVGEKRKQWLEDASRERAWLIEMWHNISSKDDGGFQTILKEDAEKHLEAIKFFSEGGLLWAARMTDALKYIIERQQFEPVAMICDNELHVFLSSKNGAEDIAFFDHPLTVLVKDPGREVCGCDGTVVIDDSVWYMVDVVPGKVRRCILNT